MKALHGRLASIFFSTLLLAADRATAQFVTQTNAAVAEGAPALTVTGRGADFRVWGRVTALGTNAQGQVQYRTNASFTELATGLHHLVGTNWVESTEDIAITADGGAATNGPQQVHFAANINTAGAIQLTTPDGKLLKSHIIGLSYFDSTANTNVLIAVLQDRIGNVYGSNQVIYTNAFSGLNADVRYTVKNGSFEQDVILREQPASPSSYGLNPQTTQLQVWTEFVDPPAPQITAEGADNRLSFGAMQMGEGKAFLAGVGDSNAVPVVKQWASALGRNFLVENVPFAGIAPRLQTLPTHPSSGGTNSGGTNGGFQQIKFQGFPKQMPAAPKLAQRNNGGLKLARMNPPAELGLVMDYMVVGSSVTNYTFQGDTTYFISGPLNLYGTTTVEGGAVIKYTNNQFNAPSLSVNGTFSCQTAPYRPAIFTSSDDNSVGQTLPGSSGSPSLVTYSTYLYLANGGAVSNLRFSYAWNAVGIYGSDAEIWDCQFIKCSHALTTRPENTTMGLHNVLLTMDDSINNSGPPCYCPPAAITGYATSIQFYCENVTMDLQSQNFMVYYTTVSTPSNVVVSLTNSIILSPHLNPVYTGGSSVGITVGTNAVYYSSASPGNVFQSVGGGNYYLPAYSVYRNSGSSNISAALLSELRQKTTYPPILLTNDFSSDTTLLPLYIADAGSPPDYGYHYDRLDYVWSNRTVSSSKKLVLTNGVAVGVCGTSGLTMASGSSLFSEGTPLALNRFGPCALVQEQPLTATTNLIGGNGGWSNINLRFTSLPVLGGSTAYLSVVDSGGIINAGPLTMRDCQLAGGQLAVQLGLDYGAGHSSMTVALTNNLFERCQLTFWREYQVPSDLSITLGNNLFHAGALVAQYYLVSYGTNADHYGDMTSWSLVNNLFEHTSLSSVGGSGSLNVYDEDNVLINTLYWTAFLNNGHNGYVGGGTPGNSSGGDQTPATADFQTGPLGKYYYPTNGTNLASLINQGNTTANVLGLYHFTTITNQTKEGTSTVDIGFHYVALGTNNLPADTDGDGLADYFEDRNGNGTYDAGVDLADWNASDTFSKGMSDGWQWKYFGNFSQTSGGDYDGDEISNGSEYSGQTDPNKIVFTAIFTNQYTPTRTVNASVAIAGGVPAYWSAMLNSTDFNEAIWQPYTSSNLTLNLPAVDGVYDVWIGLKGLAPDSAQSWDMNRMTLDTVAPSVVITSPTPGTTSQPVVELKGYSPERLMHLEFDVTNAAGCVSNQSGGVTDMYVDTNTLAISTNWFTCDFLNFTNGSNFVTVRATDMAGNVSTNYYTYVLDYSTDTNAPVLTLYWPQDGDQVSGSEFELRGFLDDPTATVSARIVNSDDFTNSVTGLVEMNGLMWIEHLPLAAGTNTVTLTMTDAAGNSSVSNLTVIGSSLNLTVDDVSSDNLRTATTTVTGTIDNTNYTVWLNGVKVTNYSTNGLGAWTWSASGVTNDLAGTATFQARAIPNTDNGGSGSGGSGGAGSSGNPGSTNAVTGENDIERPAFISVKTYTKKTSSSVVSHSAFGDVNNHWWDNLSWSGVFDPPTGQMKHGGDANTGYTYIGGWQSNTTHWPMHAPDGEDVGTLVTYDSADPPETNTDIAAPSPLPSIHWSEDYDFRLNWGGYYVTNSGTDEENTVYAFLTGGKRRANKSQICRASATVTEYTERTVSYEWLTKACPGGDITIAGKKCTPLDGDDDEGYAYFVMAENSMQIIDVKIPYWRFTYALNMAKLPMISTCQADIPKDKHRTTIGVGEEVDVRLAVPFELPESVYWTTTGGGVAAGPGTWTQFIAPSNADTNGTKVTVTASVADVKNTIDFTVFPPSDVMLTKQGTDKHVSGLTSAGFIAKVTIMPTNVSFYAAQVQEDAAAAVNTSGPWASIGEHPPSGWVRLNEDNTIINDHNGNDYIFGGLALPGAYTGGYTWVLPWRYHVETGDGTVFKTFTSVFSATNGTAQINKNEVSTDHPIPVDAASTDWPF